MLHIRFQETGDSSQQICAICGAAFSSAQGMHTIYENETLLGPVCMHCAGLNPGEIPAQLRESGRQLAMLAQQLIESAERRVALADKIEAGKAKLTQGPLTLYIGK